jgi:hypothetical protein
MRQRLQNRCMRGLIVVMCVLSCTTAATASAAPGHSYISVSTFQIDFGDCAVGTTCGYQTLTYTNISSSTLAVDAETFIKPSFFQVSLFSGCVGFDSSVGLASGGYCTDFITFHPEEAKTYTNLLCLNFPDQSPSKVCVRLTGRGTT